MRSPGSPLLSTVHPSPACWLQHLPFAELPAPCREQLASELVALCGFVDLILTTSLGELSRCETEAPAVGDLFKGMQCGFLDWSPGPLTGVHTINLQSVALGPAPS